MEDHGAIQLAAVRQLVEARQFDDDWTGLTDPVERKKRQNRLNRRAYRRRRNLASTGAEYGGVDIMLDAYSLNGRRIDSEYMPAVPSSPNACRGYSSENVHDLSQGRLPHELKTSSTSATHIHHPRFPDPALPLSCDHLIVLIHYNVWRACLSNLMTMSLQGLLTKDCVLVTSKVPKVPVPQNMFPTSLQQHVLHPAWIDIFPDPRLRDNMILSQGYYDEKILFNDLIGNVCTGTALSCSTGELKERNGLIVWSQPWDINSWEITPGFLKRWAQLVRGCEELVASSNRWRAQRDEVPLEDVCT